jgi:hypothetical protein
MKPKKIVTKFFEEILKTIGSKLPIEAGKVENLGTDVKIRSVFVEATDEVLNEHSELLQRLAK